MDIIQDDMPNKHLEHPEDTIFDGRRVALKAITEMITCGFKRGVVECGARQVGAPLYTGQGSPVAHS